MAKRTSVYLSQRALTSLEILTQGLSELAGCKVSRSAALTSLLENDARAYLADRKALLEAIEKYAPVNLVAGIELPKLEEVAE